MRGIICAFFMAAFAFGYLYFLIELLTPGSFHLSNKEALTTASLTDYFSQMLYFSFVSVLAVGFGDITPVKDVAQTAVVIEAIFGQFYVAILVARLVSIYAFHSDKKMIKTLEKDIAELKSKKN